MMLVEAVGFWQRTLFATTTTTTAVVRLRYHSARQASHS